MAMATKLQWLPRLLLLIHSTFFLLSHTAALPWTLDHASGLHPVVLLPGSTCSQIEVRLTDAYQPPSPLCAAHKGDGQWHRLWKNAAAPDADAPCFADQFKLVYDDVAGDYCNAPGVETRPVSFGSTRSFLADNPADKELCMGKLVEALERAGYRDGETLFGAPYDFRHAPAPPGTANRELSGFRRQLRELVERASRSNGDKPVVLVSHSQGGYFALEFLNRSPLPWRRRFVKHFVMASTGAGGFVLLMQSLPSSGSSTSQARMIFPGTFSALPSPVAFGDGTPLAVTANRSYAPEVVYGDGDGVVNLASILALDTVMGGDPVHQDCQYVSPWCCLGCSRPRAFAW